PEGEDRAVLLAADGDRVALRPAVGHRDHVLAAGLRPPHRTPRPSRGPGQYHRFGVDTDLRAEATADIRGDHADLSDVETEPLGQTLLSVVRVMRLQPAGQARGLAPGAARYARFQSV